MTPTREMTLQPLSELLYPLNAADDPQQVGGKAWNLSRMASLGLPVPAGFVLTDRAFQSFLVENRLNQPIAAAIRGLETEGLPDLERAAGRIRELVLGAPLPGGVRRAVGEGLSKLGSGSQWIVRSSAVGEDSAKLSFAGQLDSFPDLCSREEIEQAILRCWASFWSTRVLHYQQSRGVRLERMGVIVQEQVCPALAGVLFTVAPGPSTPGPGEAVMLGEYCHGHGEALVSGRINPGRFTLSREGPGWELLAAPETDDDTPAAGVGLDDPTVGTLRQIGLRLERELGCSQDIEWVIDPGGVVHVVQSRPITARHPPHTQANHAKDPGVNRVVWSNANISENYPDPVSPFLYSVASDGYYHYFRNLALAFGIPRRRVQAMDGPLRGLVGTHSARLYYNLTNIHRALRMAPLGDYLVDSFNLFVGAAKCPPPATKDPSFARRPGGRVARSLEWMCIGLKVAWQFLFLDRRVTRFEKTVDGYAALTEPQALREHGLGELHDALRGFLEIRCHRWTNASLADAAAMIGYGLLKRLVAQTAPGEAPASRHNKLLQGLPNLVSGEPVDALWRLSRSIRGTPALRDLFTEEDDGAVWRRLNADTGLDRFRKQLTAFLSTWGFRCSGELMLTVASFQEDPRGLIPLLRGYANLDGASPMETLRRQAEERQTETRRVLRALGNRRVVALAPWPHQGTLARLVLWWTQNAIRLRERARLKQSLLYSRCRRVLLRLGEELTQRGSLQQVEDVFFLTHQELTALVTGHAMFPDAVRPLVELRRSEHARLGKQQPPDTVVLEEGAYLAAEPHGSPYCASPSGPDGELLSGVGACGGRVEARAQVLSSVTEAGRLHPGDVLVTRQTDPGWAPVFFVVGGLVMERGGMLSHGAILAREYGIPTVVGVPGATQRIHSGDFLKVDGDRGHVRRLA